MKKTLILLFVLTLALLHASCSDDVSKTYSQKYRVMCGFSTTSYPELLAVMDNFGQWATIRQSGSKIIMSSASSTNSYNIDALSESFQYGLGGIIVGTDIYGNYRAYDLACPNCDQASRRLSISDDGTCQCARCEVTYDLNNDGVIVDKGNGTHAKPRGLWRYPVKYGNFYVQIIN